MVPVTLRGRTTDSLIDLLSGIAYYKRETQLRGQQLVFCEMGAHKTPKLLSPSLDPSISDGPLHTTNSLATEY